MKNSFFEKISFCLFLMAFLISCEEVPIIVEPALSVGDCVPVSFDLVENQRRQVLVEEFTGVRCVNCPEGSEELERLIGQYGDQVVVLSFHAGFFSDPYPESQEDFRTTAGDGLLSFLGSPLGYPASIINRKKFNGANRLHQVGTSLWNSSIAAELELPLMVRLYGLPNYNAQDNSLSVQLSVFWEETFTAEEEIRMSLFLIENNIADSQETPQGVDPNYLHQHVLRSNFTAPTGNIISAEEKAQSSFCNTYEIILEDNWKVEDLKVIAFIHKGGDAIEVLQAYEVSVL